MMSMIFEMRFFRDEKKEKKSRKRKCAYHSLPEGDISACFAKICNTYVLSFNSQPIPYNVHLRMRSSIVNLKMLNLVDFVGVSIGCYLGKWEIRRLERPLWCD